MNEVRIGWIGTGIMGASMCGHLMAAGHPVTIFNRTRTRAEDLIARGATWADSPRAGAAATFARVRPLFERLGTTIVHQGPAGSGQHTKMVNQILIATGMIGLCEALVYARKSGLDVPTVLASVSGGAAGSWSLTNYTPRILQGDLEPGFFVEHFIKDMEIALAEARRLDLALPGLALAHELYLALRAQGGGRRGTQALILALARLSDVDWKGTAD